MRRTEALQGVRMIKFWHFRSVRGFGVQPVGGCGAFVSGNERSGAGVSATRGWRGGVTGPAAGQGFRQAGSGDRADEVEALYRTRYAGFTAKHFHEHLVKDHRFNWSYTWTKTFLQSKGLLEKARRRGAHRRKRPRRPLPGMLLHQDGSRHQWLAGQPMLDLIVPWMTRRARSIRRSWWRKKVPPRPPRAEEVFGRHGLPLSLYTDRGSHYFHTATAGGAVDRAALTQVGRALAHLGVEHIAAYLRKRGAVPSVSFIRCKTG